MGISAVLCTCGGVLEKYLDFDELESYIKRNKDVVMVRRYPALCTQDSKELIQDFIKSGAKALLVIACSKYICSPSLEKAAEVLGVDLTGLVEFVNIREQCAWICEDRKNATEKALLMIAAALEKARALEPVKKRKFKVKEAVLVIGGGVAGIQASLDLANQGFKGYLVESSPSIGGTAALLVRTFPMDDCDCAICVKGFRMTEAAMHPNIELLTYCEVKEVKRYPWGFKVKILKKPRYVDYDKCIGCGICAEKCPVEVPNEWDRGLSHRKAIYLPFPHAIPCKYTIDPEHCLYFTKKACRVCEEVCPYNAIDFNQKPEEIELEVGAIIVATGSEEYDPSALPKYGYGKYKDVITQLQLERILDPSGPTGGRLIRPSDGKPPARIVMVQCVGSRDPEANPYCSRYCCMEAIKNAILIKTEHNPEAKITILYKDIRTYGRLEEYYIQAKDELGIEFVQGEVTKVYEEKPGYLVVEYQDPLGNVHSLPADMVVLACAMVPRKSFKDLAKVLGVELDEYGFFKELDRKVGSVETKIPGIFICGTCQGPKDVSESIAQASAAAMLAALHISQYREKKLLIPTLDEDLCGRCGLCVLSCPYGALTLEEKGPIVDEMLCQGCGICASVCPNNAINIVNSASELITRQIKSVMEEAKALGRRVIIALCCEECAHTLMDTVGFYHEEYPSEVIPIFVPCLGILSIGHILMALNYGADGVLLVGCPLDRCHFEQGAEIAMRRVLLIKSILEEIGLIPDRVRIVNLSGTMVEDFLKASRELVNKLIGR